MDHFMYFFTHFYCYYDCGPNGQNGPKNYQTIEPK